MLVKPLAPWPRLKPETHAHYQIPTQQQRLWTISSYVMPGDRVLDIGSHHGYIAGILARDRGVQSYCGIDTYPHMKESCEQMARANALDVDRMEFHVLSLFDLSPDFIARRKPTLIIMTEVLEHLPKYADAFAHISRVCLHSQEACLLCSVPLQGHLTETPGHVKDFSICDLVDLAREAGVQIHFTEPIAKTWRLSLFSRSIDPPDRVDFRLSSSLPGCYRPEERGLARSCEAQSEQPSREIADVKERETSLRRAVKDCQEEAERTLLRLRVIETSTSFLVGRQIVDAASRPWKLPLAAIEVVRLLGRGAMRKLLRLRTRSRR